MENFNKLNHHLSNLPLWVKGTGAVAISMIVMHVTNLAPLNAANGLHHALRDQQENNQLKLAEQQAKTKAIKEEQDHTALGIQIQAQLSDHFRPSGVDQKDFDFKNDKTFTVTLVSPGSDEAPAKCGGTGDQAGKEAVIKSFDCFWYPTRYVAYMSALVSTITASISTASANLSQR